MDTEIEQLESRIKRLRADLEEAEAAMIKIMTNSDLPRSVCDIKTMEDVRFWLDRGYWLANYTPGRITMFCPPPGGGSLGYVYGPLADELGVQYDAWNFEVHRNRRAAIL